MNMQQGDVLLCQTINDGEINIVAGVVQMSGGLETAAYLSLFGGNEGDDALNNNAENWWGNLDEQSLARQYRSQTQNLLNSLPATSSNLLRVEDAAKRDLNWFLSENVASNVTVAATMPGLNKIKLTIFIQANGEESSFEFTENWRALS